MAKDRWILWKDELYRISEDGSMYEGELRLATDSRGALKIVNNTPVTLTPGQDGALQSPGLAD